MSELLRVEGLREVRLGVAAIGFATWVARCGEDHQRHVAERHTQLARERWAIDAGHLHVEDDEGRRVGLHHLHRLGAVTRLDHAEAVVVEQRPLRGARRCVVVEDSLGGVLSAKRAGLRCVAVTHSCSAEDLLLAGADAVAVNLASLGDVLLEDGP